MSASSRICVGLFVDALCCRHLSDKPFRKWKQLSLEADAMGPNRIPRRDWLLGTSASLVTLAASTSNAAALAQPGTPTSPQQPQATSEAEDADRVRRMKWGHEARFGMFR